MVTWKANSLTELSLIHVERSCLHFLRFFLVSSFSTSTSRGVDHRQTGNGRGVVNSGDAGDRYESGRTHPASSHRFHSALSADGDHYVISGGGGGGKSGDLFFSGGERNQETSRFPLLKKKGAGFLVADHAGGKGGRGDAVAAAAVAGIGGRGNKGTRGGRGGRGGSGGLLWMERKNNQR